MEIFEKPVSLLRTVVHNNLYMLFSRRQSDTS